MARVLKYGVIDSDFTVSSEQQPSLPDLYSSQLLLQGLQRHVGQTLVVDAATGEKLSGQQVMDIATNISHGLHDIGLSVGDRVFCCCVDTALYACTIVGIQFAALIYSGNFWMMKKREIRNQVSGLQARAICCSHINLHTAIEVADEVSSVTCIVVLADISRSQTETGKAIIPISELVAAKSQSNIADVPFIPSLPPQQAPAYIMYSSGSTGLPKGCVITHANDVARCMAIASRQSHGRKILSFTVGFPHTVGLMALHVAIIRGNTIVIDNQIELELDRFLRVVQDHRCTSAWLGPSQLTSLSKNLNLLHNFDVSSLTEIKTGGAVLCDSVAQAFASATNGKIRVRNVYGLTEVGDLTIVPDLETSSLSVGSLIPFQSVRIIDRDSGVVLDLHQVGEICVSGPQVTPGYLDRPDADEEHRTADGWFKTGDMGYFDADGLLFVVDRYKEVIKVFGEQVTPAELESVLLSHESVAEAAVVGVTSRETCEAPVAFVVLKSNETASSAKEQLMQFVNNQVVDYKQIRGGLFFEDALPKISIGKIDRKLLKQKAAALLDSILSLESAVNR